ncbi:alpha/beta fold hydrolase [Rhodocyclus gracilis]|uniref:Malonyl-[acyl-carrier protein] O-methyltransferase n=1 Tax=Rhodocyclus tenuis TaxID=1066 RepID=A0A6L5JY70_RHOTE|nr:alpha/beta fold hydrolase [Rhodocyclus gracilis]MQY51996.1 alpha/beta fold hydrolase [Rhodocyclus gracilis]
MSVSVAHPPRARAPSRHLALIHGWGFGAEVWQSTLSALRTALAPLDHPLLATPQTDATQAAAPHWQIHRLSLPGYDGVADRDETFAACAQAMVDALPAGVVLGGWSLGGLLALHAAAANPEKIGGLILIGATPCFQERADWPAAQPAATLAGFREALASDAVATRRRFAAQLNQGDRQARPLTRALTNLLATTPAPAPAALARGLDWLRDVDLRPPLRACRVPTLIVHGAHDAIAPPGAAEFLAAQIETSEYVCLADAAHAPFLAEPEQVAAAIARFLGKNIAQSGAADPTLPPKRLVRAAFDRAAAAYDDVAVIQRRVAALLCAGLPKTLAPTCDDAATLGTAPPHAPAPWRAPSPTRPLALDAGCGTGFGGLELRARWEGIELVAADFAPAMLAHPTHGGSARVASDIEALPFAPGVFDLYWSSLAVQWCDSARVLAEAARSLRAGGHLALSTLGPDTFAELRQSFAGIDRYRHTLAFTDPDTVREHLQQAGFVDIRLERQTLTLHYDTLRALLAAVRDIGANGVGGGARRGLMSRRVWQAFTAAYEAQRQPAGLPASYDVILVHARKAAHPPAAACAIFPPTF